MPETHRDRKVPESQLAAVSDLLANNKRESHVITANTNAELEAVVQGFPNLSGLKSTLFAGRSDCRLLASKQ